MLMRSPARQWTSDPPPVSRARPGRTPVGINIAVGSVLVVVAALAAAALPAPAAAARFEVLVGAVLVFAAGTLDLAASAAVTGIGYLTFDGFVVNRLGTLTWRGITDIRHLAYLALAVAVGFAVGEWYRLIRRHHSGN